MSVSLLLQAVLNKILKHRILYCSFQGSALVLKEKNQYKFTTLDKAPSFECIMGHLAEGNLAV